MSRRGFRGREASSTRPELDQLAPRTGQLSRRGTNNNVACRLVLFVRLFVCTRGRRETPPGASWTLMHPFPV